MIILDYLLRNYTPEGIINYGSSNLLDIYNNTDVLIGLYYFSYIIIVISVLNYIIYTVH